MPTVIDLFCDKSDMVMMEYVIFTWKLVSRSDIDFRICNRIDQLQSTIVIIYGSELPKLKTKKVLFVRRSQDTKWQYKDLQMFSLLQEDRRLSNTMLPVFEGTISNYCCDGKPLLAANGSVYACFVGEDGRCFFGVDMFFNIFAHLTCAEERQKQSKNKNITSYASDLRSDKRWLSLPVVNYYYAILERALELIGIDRLSTFPYATYASICFTHDVDVLKKDPGFFLKQTYLQCWQAIRRPQKIRFFSKAVYNRCFRRWTDDGIDALLAIEQNSNIKSTFFVSTANSIERTAKTLFLEPSYNLGEEVSLKERLLKLSASGWEIGIHGSFAAHCSDKRLLEERYRLEQIIVGSVKVGRQHWLSLNHSTSWSVFENSGIKVDTSLGYNDSLGFRSGLCHLFQPFIVNRNVRSNVFSLPMMAMDSTLYDYHCMDDAEVLKQLDKLLNEIKKFSGTVSVLWHTHGFNKNYSWGDVYNRLIQMCKEKNIQYKLVSETING